MQSFLLKVEIPDDLRQKDVIEDLKLGLRLKIGGGDPECPYLQRLERVKLRRYFPRRAKAYVRRPILKRD